MSHPFNTICRADSNRQSETKFGLWRKKDKRVLWSHQLSQVYIYLYNEGSSLSSRFASGRESSGWCESLISCASLCEWASNGKLRQITRRDVCWWRCWRQKARVSESYIINVEKSHAVNHCYQLPQGTKHESSDWVPSSEQISWRKLLFWAEYEIQILNFIERRVFFHRKMIWEPALFVGPKSSETHEVL